MSRGAARRGAADRVDQRKILLQQLVADHGRNRGGVTRSELARRLLELRRTHVVCRRIDEVARQRHALDDMFQVLARHALRQIELDRARLGFAVAREPIAAERESERSKPRIVRLIGEAINAVGQMLRQSPRQEGIPGFVGAFDAEQHAAQRNTGRGAGSSTTLAGGFGRETTDSGRASARNRPRRRMRSPRRRPIAAPPDSSRPRRTRSESRPPRRVQ